MGASPGSVPWSPPADLLVVMIGVVLPGAPLVRFHAILSPLAVLVTFFQPSTWPGLSPLPHAIAVLGQSIDNPLLPRILGSSLTLNPVPAIMGAAAGAGVIVLVLERLTCRKLIALSPWGPPVDAPTPHPQPSRLVCACGDG